jgi:hypothetical protein
MLAKAAGLLAAGALLVLIPLGAAQTADRGTLPRLTEVSHDVCASPLSYHSSQVEPMIASHGQMLVATFQVGRVYDGGSCDIGWSTSMDGGRTWQTGLLPLTIFGGQATTDAGPLERASDPAVAYDAQDGVWLIDTLGLSGDALPGLFVNRSTDGLSRPPITHALGAPGQELDHGDNWPTARATARYQEWDDGAADQDADLHRRRLTWSPPARREQREGIGGVPLVQPPPPTRRRTSAAASSSRSRAGMSWFTSSDCGASGRHRGDPEHDRRAPVAGGFRTSLLPASAIDGAARSPRSGRRGAPHAEHH